MSETSTNARNAAVPVITAWTAGHLAKIRSAPDTVLPLIIDRDVERVSEAVDIWDAWPVQEEDGRPSLLGDGATLWMALAAPRFPDPDERHSHARIHLFRRDTSGWTHLGPAMPDGFSPGSREWSGSAVLAEDRHGVTLYFTATGQRGEAKPSFTQRIWRAFATLDDVAGGRLTDWRGLSEIIVRDPSWYMASDAGPGSVGTIKAFRDPAYFRDPVTGKRFLTFAASDARSPSDFNGAIGLAVAANGEAVSWTIQPPIVTASGLNNELERPHLVYHGGAYYLFWSTQAHVFNPAGATGPTGLYGMTSSRIEGPWEALNGSGLVFANPIEAPAQGYSWLVLPDLRVISFIDNWGQRDLSAPRRFGATFAPEMHLELRGAKAGLKG